jgi:hypothetical protein
MGSATGMLNPVQVWLDGGAPRPSEAVSESAQEQSLGFWYSLTNGAIEWGTMSSYPPSFSSR